VAEGPSNADAAAAGGGVGGEADAPLNTAGRARDADAGRLNSGGKDEDGGGAGVKGSNCMS
jgi:hypothetical protein